MVEEPISKWVPHEPPARLVEDVLEMFPNGLCARVVWPDAEASPFLLIEAAAQSVAAYQGYQKTLRGEPLTEGFLVGVRDFTLPETMPTGGIWTVRIQENKNLRPFYLFDATVLHGNQPQASGTITLYEKEPA
jgi:predicted hotdog family 3-hydroxylacyl-ACP dehydratase